MGKKTFSSKNETYYKNLIEMMQEFSIPHEGNPDVSLEMLEILHSEDKIDKESYERMCKMLSYGLAAHEGGIAKYEAMVHND